MENISYASIDNDQYLLMLNALPIPVYYLDSNLRYKFTNAAYEQWLGGYSGSLIGKSISEVMGEKSYNNIQVYVTKALNGEYVEFEAEMSLFFKDYVIVKATYTPEIDDTGNVKGYIAMLNDVTEKRIMDAELKQKNEELKDYIETKVQERIVDIQRNNMLLKESEERYHRMVEEVEDYAIILMDKNGCIQNWNKGAEKIKGYKEEEIIGKNFRLFYLPEDRESGLPERLIAEAVKEGRATHEGWRLTKYGERFWGSVVITALHDDDDNVVGFTKLTRNLTERKLAEDKLKQNASELEAQNKELEQFAYLASHDMKEPLRKIILYNNLLKENIGNDVSAKVMNYLDRSQNAAMRMQRLIEDLLSYSKTSFYSEGFDMLDLNPIVSEVVDFYSETLQEIGGAVNVPQLPSVRGISFQLRQLFDNIIGNAIKYKSNDRPLLVTINNEIVEKEELPQILQENRTNYYKISVSDNGMGFSAEYAQKIFEIFQRLVTKEQFSGSGIGLSICKKIMYNHKGAIEAVGAEGEGATFNIFLPVPVKIS
jgi:PAS domain S-box-containing protein